MNQGLSGQEIYDMLKANAVTRKAFLDVYSVDTIDHAAITRQLVRTHNNGIPTCCIVNTEDSHDPTGEHWVTVAFASRRDGPVCYYLDSYGFGPVQPNLYNLVTCYTEQSEYNAKMLQNLEDDRSAACGYYAVFFVNAVCYGWTLKDVVLDLDLFGTDYKKNDSFVIDFCKRTMQ